MSNTKQSPSPLPYRDNKPVGAPDFYFAINATFRFILNTLGVEGLRRYWSDMGKSYFAPVTARWRDQGLKGVASYWRAFFEAEPGAAVDVVTNEDTVTLEVRVCPAIKHLRAHGREIVPVFVSTATSLAKQWVLPPESRYGLMAAMGPVAKLLHVSKRICRHRILQR
jgi:hypothetical protein